MINDFKVGDEVYFLLQDYAPKWGEECIRIIPQYIEIIKGKIVYINVDKDAVHVYSDGCESVCIFGYYYFHENVYKSKNEAIDALIKHLEGMKDE